MPDVDYILGHSDGEVRRLQLQARILRPITARLLREAGITPGMRVLDLGCGAGDVTMLAADLVGTSGSVVGIDRNGEVIATARERAQKAGYSNVTFRQGAAEEFTDPTPYDMAVGRYVLIHQGSPVTFIRAAASHVRRGGAVAFHEIEIDSRLPGTTPFIWNETLQRIEAALRAVMIHPDAASRMSAHFLDAGLEQPRAFCEAVVGSGPQSPIYEWLSLTLRSLMPQLESMGLASAAAVDIDTLEERLREAVCAERGQAISPLQFCGWSRM